jgi:hypothetical protein
MEPTVPSHLTAFCAGVAVIVATISGISPSVALTPPPQPDNLAPAVGAFDPHIQNPSVHEWDLTIQRELPLHIVAEVGYVGKRGTHLYRGYDLNQISTNQPGFLYLLILHAFCCRLEGRVLRPPPMPCGRAPSSRARRSINWSMADRSQWRTPEILCDASLAILGQEPRILFFWAVLEARLSRLAAKPPDRKYSRVENIPVVFCTG